MKVLILPLLFRELFKARLPLVAVKKQVNRGGEKTFTETFWVRPGEEGHVFRIKTGESRVPLKIPGKERIVPEFSYVQGEKGAAEEHLDRIKKLKIPPEATNVRINPDPSAPLQALWKDAKGRTQSRYSLEHSAQSSDTKWERLKTFDLELSKIRKAVLRDLKNDNPKIRDAAALLYLIDHTAFRVGGKADTKAKKKAYGASTLLGKHVSIVGAAVTFDFVGKKGVHQRREIRDELLVRIISERKREPDNPLFSVGSNYVRSYLKKIDGDQHVHDFRGYHGTELAKRLMNEMTPPATKQNFVKAQREVADKVAEFLGNTRAVALSAYINPAVWAPWEKTLINKEKVNDRSKAI